MRLKSISMSFLWASIFDVLTTLIGLQLGIMEINIIVAKYGWLVASIAKIIGTGFCVYIFEKEENFWAFWIPVVIIWLAVAWNIINLLVTIFYFYP
jgi:hypothetical protein